MWLSVKVFRPGRRQPGKLDGSATIPQLPEFGCGEWIYVSHALLRKHLKATRGNKE